MRLCGPVSFDAEPIPTGTPDAEGFGLSATVPNPLAWGTEIAYSVPVGSARVELTAYNVAGRLVTTLVDGEAVTGGSVVFWGVTDVSGERAVRRIYSPRLSSGERAARKRIVLVRQDGGLSVDACPYYWLFCFREEE